MSTAQQRNALKLEKMHRKIKEGLIVDRFPEVSKIVIRMTYSEKKNMLNMVRTIYFSPTHYAYFNMECITRKCADGGFDLASEILHLVNNNVAFGQGRMFCSRNHCPATIDYKISICYKKPGAEFLPK
jgi:hypothetical protein